MYKLSSFDYILFHKGPEKEFSHSSSLEREQNSKI